jgi:hypothetical protein
MCNKDFYESNERNVRNVRNERKKEFLKELEYLNKCTEIEIEAEKVYIEALENYMKNTDKDDQYEYGTTETTENDIFERIFDSKISENKRNICRAVLYHNEHIDVEIDEFASEFDFEFIEKNPHYKRDFELIPRYRSSIEE